MGRIRDIKDKIKSSMMNQASFDIGNVKILDFMGEGSTRVVAETDSLPGKVVKFPSEQKYIQTNKKELATWKAYRKTDKRDYLVPIDLDQSDPNGRYIVMDYADNSSGDKYDLGFESSDKLCEEFDNPNVTPRVVDLSPPNIAFHEGDYKLIDYGWLPP